MSDLLAIDVSGQGHGPALTWSQATPSPTGFPSCHWAMGSGLQRLDLDPEAKACSAPARGALDERCWWRVYVGPSSFCPVMGGRLCQCPLLLLTAATYRPLLIGQLGCRTQLCSPLAGTTWLSLSSCTGQVAAQRGKLQADEPGIIPGSSTPTRALKCKQDLQLRPSASTLGGAQKA